MCASPRASDAAMNSVMVAHSDGEFNNNHGLILDNNQISPEELALLAKLEEANRLVLLHITKFLIYFLNNFHLFIQYLLTHNTNTDDFLYSVTTLCILYGKFFGGGSSLERESSFTPSNGLLSPTFKKWRWFGKVCRHLIVEQLKGPWEVPLEYWKILVWSYLREVHQRPVAC